MVHQEGNGGDAVCPGEARGDAVCLGRGVNVRCDVPRRGNGGVRCRCAS